MNREKFLPAITILICCVVAIFFINIIYAPLESAISSMQMQARKLHGIERDLDNFKKSHGDIEKFFTLTENRLIESREFLPPESAQDTFVAEIYKIAEKNNVRINSVQVGEMQAVEKNSEDNKKFFRQSINVKIDADYISTLKFLREILNGNRLTTLENISVDSGENILKGDIEFLIFNLAASG